VTRIAVLCPGRGSYTEKSLGSLAPGDERVLAADRIRAELDLESLADLDAAGRFEPSRHLRPANAAALIYVVSMIDGAAATAEHETVCIGGNSLGWYTALALGGALSFEDGFRLVQRMALLQEGDGAKGGGQVIYPTVDESWRPDPERTALVRRLAEAGDGEVFPSIRLGGFRVLAGTAAGVERCLAELPAAKLGKTTYPFRLAQHGPYHTPLVSGVAERARRELEGLQFGRPHTTLIDGRGVRFTPWSTDVAALRAYTLGAQVETPYDFTASVRVALCEHAPERLVLPGPGATLRNVCGQILAELGWRGVGSREDFERVQENGSPIVETMD